MVQFSKFRAGNNPFSKNPFDFEEEVQENSKDNHVTSDFHVSNISKNSAKSQRDDFQEHEEESDLPVDVYNTPESIIIVAQIAGVKNEDIFVKVNKDVLTLSGIRRKPQEIQDIADVYLHTEECSWGGFKRSIILPQTVDIRKIKAKLTKENILILTIPKTDISSEQIIKIELE